VCVARALADDPNMAWQIDDMVEQTSLDVGIPGQVTWIPD
jgi:hypothetical protein